jgi:iron complex outermembrane receptor protein
MLTHFRYGDFSMTRSSSCALFAPCLLATLLASHAIAQTTSEVQAAPEKKGKDRPERIEVTGSRLKKIDIQGAIPVKSITPEDIEKAGINSVSDLFRNQSENTFGSFNGGVGYISQGQAVIDLKGLGANRVLILVNGRRLPSEASLGGTNINNIPIAMIERIDVLKMSASAVYGADAVAGVVNVILKKNYQGTEVMGAATVTQRGGGNNYTASAVTGFEAGPGTITLAVGGRRNERIASKDRAELWDFNPGYKNNVTGSPSGTYTWGIVNPTSGDPFDTSGDFAYRPSDNCPAGNREVWPEDGVSTQCVGDARAASEGLLTGQVDEIFATVDSNFTFGDLETNVTLLTSQTKSETRSNNRFNLVDPAFSQAFVQSAASAPQAIQDAIRAAGLDPETANIKLKGRAPIRILGDEQTSDQMIGGIAAFKGPAWVDWTWNVDVSTFSTTRKRFYNKVPDTRFLYDNVFSYYLNNNPSNPKWDFFNPTAFDVSPGFADLDGSELNTNTNATAYITGDTFSLPAGTVALAGGLSYLKETYELKPDVRDQEVLTDPQSTRYWGSTLLNKN